MWQAKYLYSKYNQLLRIEEALGVAADYPGIKTFNINR